MLLSLPCEEGIFNIKQNLHCIDPLCILRVHKLRRVMKPEAVFGAIYLVPLQDTFCECNLCGQYYLTSSIKYLEHFIYLYYYLLILSLPINNPGDYRHPQYMNWIL